jgi:hypothetical protein
MGPSESRADIIKKYFALLLSIAFLSFFFSSPGFGAIKEGGPCKKSRIYIEKSWQKTNMR